MVDRYSSAFPTTYMLAMFLILCLISCTHLDMPTSSFEPVNLDSRIGATLVLPAPTDDLGQADRSFAASLVALAVLEARVTPLSLAGPDALVRQFGDSGRCWLDTHPCPTDLLREKRGVGMEVAENQGAMVVLRSGGGLGDRSRAGESLLSRIYAPAEELGPQLLKLLRIPASTLERTPDVLHEVATLVDPALPHRGACVGRDAVQSLGRGARLLLKATLSVGSDRAKGLELAVAELRVAWNASPTLLVTAWLASAQLEAGNIHEAATLLNVPLAPTCGAAEAIRLRGRVRIQLKQWEEGVADLGRSARLRPYNADVIGEWGVALAGNKRLADAGVALRRALVLEPAYLSYRRILADVLVLQERRSDAASVLIEGLDVHWLPVDRAWIQLDLGLLEEEASHFEKAALRYQSGLALLTGTHRPLLEAKLLNSLGVMLIYLEQVTPAIDALQKAVALRRSSAGSNDLEVRRQLATSLYNLGVAHAHQRNWLLAKESLLEAARWYESEDAVATVLDLGRLLQQGSEAQMALEVLDGLARQKEPLEPAMQAEWHYLMGLSQGDLKDYARALDHLAQSARLYAELGMWLEEGLAWFNRATTAERAKLPNLALESFERARMSAQSLDDRDSLREIDRRIRDLREMLPELHEVK